MKERLQKYDKLDKFDKVQLLIDVNNNLYEYVGLLDTDILSVRNFVLDVLDNNIGIMSREQESLSESCTKSDLTQYNE